ncbi:MAG: translocation/assembly module TamB domain-containing protein, partial [Bacteroidota bacterium]
SDQEMDFRIHVKNIDAITQIFIPSVKVSQHNYFEGYINTKTYDLHMQGGFDYISLAGRRLMAPEISITSDSTFLEMIVRGEKFYISDTIYMGQFFSSAGFAGDTINMLTQWENYDSPRQNLGSLKARGVLTGPNSANFAFRPSYAYINDSLWTIHPENRIFIDSSYVSIDNFFLSKNHESLLINGELSALAEDELVLELSNFNIENLRFLLGKKKIDFSGIASGELLLANLQNSPNITSELTIRDFAFNRDHLGDLSLNSHWDAREKAFRIDSEVIYYGNVGYNKPVVASGYFYPERENNNFDIDIVIENFKMSVFGRYMKAFASNVRGLASGRLRLEGPLSSPELSGSARLVRTGFRVDYLNTTYSFAHELTVAKDHFRFDNLVLNDTLGNSAKASGIIRHNNFRDFAVDITLLPENMVVLNTRQHQNELFYGRGFASGLVHVHGPVQDVRIDVSGTALRGTRIFLPLDYAEEVSESNFITFVPPDDNPQQSPIFTAPTTQGLGFTLNFDLEVSPEAEIQIIFDSQIGDIMRGNGFGNLQIDLNHQGDFNMYGDYTIQEGDYLFTLQNLINKRFRIEQGGTIRWTGDPYDADIDIRAVYRTRTSLHDLTINEVDSSDMYRRRMPVETVLHLTDKLFNPTIDFEIQLPGSDETTREMIERIINTEQELNRQVFSLLILNTFVPPEGGFDTALSYGMGTTSSELLSNQLSNWLSQISNDFDIGINYRPGDEISSQEIEVALSTQLFNDRVMIDGNFGVAGDNPAQTQRTSNIIGDVNVEVKLTPEGKLRVKAFNRSNTFDVLNTNAPYTQGVGIFFRREFDSFADLFKRERIPVIEIPDLDDAETSIRE